MTGRCIACYYYRRRTGREREDLAIAKATEAFEASFASDPAVKLAERLEIQRIFAKARARLP